MFDGLLTRRIGRIANRIAASGQPAPSRYLRHLGHEPGARVPGSVLRRRGGGLVAVIELRGKHGYETLSDEDVLRDRRELNAIFMDLYGERRAFAVSLSKIKADPAGYPDGEMRTAFGREVEDRYRETLYGGDTPLLDARLFVQLFARTGPAPRSKIGAGWIHEKRRRRAEKRDEKRLVNPKAAHRARALADMESMISRAMDRLKAYGPTLKAYREDADGYLYSEPMEALARILFNEDFAIRVPRGQASRAMHQRLVAIAGPVVHVHRPGGDRFGTQFTITDYAVGVKPNVLRPVLDAAHPSTTTNTFAFWHPVSARDRMKLKSNQWVTANDPAAEQGEKLDHAAGLVMDGHFHIGGHYLHHVAYAADAGGEGFARLANQRRVAQAAEGDLHRLNAAPEAFNGKAAFYAQLADNEDLQPCPGACSTFNMASYAPLWLPDRGAAKGHKGLAPILLLKTSANTGHRLHLHAAKSLDETGDLGNCLGIGPSGSGKTVLAGRCLLGFERHDGDAVVYDKDEGLRILLEYQGAPYLDLVPGLPSGMAPLKGLDDSPAHRAFLASWLLARRAAAGRPFSVQQQQLVHAAIEGVMTLPRRQRAMREVRAQLGHDGDWLDPWCAGPGGGADGGGALWWAFDGPEDKIMERHRLTGRNIGRILDHPDVAGPAMDYMFFSDADRLDGERRFLMLIDEFWKALSIPQFAERSNDHLKTIRKLLGQVLLFTQSIKDVNRSSIAHTIMEQTGKKFWFTNRRARWSDHEEAGMERPVFDAIRNASVAGHPFLVEGPDYTQLGFLPTPPDIIALISGNAERLKLQRRLKQQFGPEPEQWGPHYRRLWHTAETVH